MSCNNHCVQQNFPECSGRSSAPGTRWNNEKPFVAGVNESTNAVYGSNVKFNRSNVGNLVLKTNFPILQKTAATDSAGYTDADLKKANVWYSVTADEHNFYYTAYADNFGQAYRSSILVCRSREDASLVYDVNIHNFNLDTSSTRTNSKVIPALFGDTLYLTTGGVNNLGPQLFAINKVDGTLKWALAYDPPLGVEPFSTKKNGAYLRALGPEYGNARAGDLNINVLEKCGKQIVYVGVSSLQNTDFGNPGVSRGQLPFFTDSGKLFAIEDFGTGGKIVGSLSTTPEPFPIGATLTADNDELNPIFPGYDHTIIATQGFPIVKNAYKIYSNNTDHVPFTPVMTEGCTPIASSVTFTKTSTIDYATVFKQDGWNLTDEIYLYPGGVKMTKAEVIAYLQEWQLNNPGPNFYFVIISYIAENLVVTLEAQLNNANLFYYKLMHYGDICENIYDQNGLSFWGNDVWGAPISIIDGLKGYFGSGQSHSQPFFDNCFYEQSEYNFSTQSDLVAEATKLYLMDTNESTLFMLNQVKEEFQASVRNSAVNAPRSPRGALAFSDGIFSFNVPDMTFRWKQRSLVNDVFTFEALDPTTLIFGFDHNEDGDTSSGVQYFNEGGIERLAAATKAGIGAIVTDTGFYQKCAYLGTDGILGGSNYQSANSGGRHLLVNQANLPLKSPSFPTVTRDGRVFQVGQSFVTSLNVYTEVVEWAEKLDNPAICAVAVANGVVFSEDFSGLLYAQDLLTGKRLLTFDAKSNNAGNGGVASPCILNNIIIWIPDYNDFGIIGNDGAYGGIYTLPPGWDESCDDLDSLADHSHKAANATQKWGRTACSGIVTKLVLKVGDKQSTVFYAVDEVDCKYQFTFLKYEGDQIRFFIKSLEIYGFANYKLTIDLDGKEVALYFTLVC